jgi:hypothetical protein
VICRLYSSSRCQKDVLAGQAPPLRNGLRGGQAHPGACGGYQGDLIAALEHTPCGMRSNAICPGAIETSMVIVDLPSSLEGLGGLVGDVAGLNLDADVVGARPSTSVVMGRAMRLRQPRLQDGLKLSYMDIRRGMSRGTNHSM